MFQLLFFLSLKNPWLCDKFVGVKLHSHLCRCNIPVILMGETGCGKTRLIKYMCDLLSLKSPGCKTLVIMKVVALLSHAMFLYVCSNVTSVCKIDSSNTTDKSEVPLGIANYYFKPQRLSNYVRLVFVMSLQCNKSEWLLLAL